LVPGGGRGLSGSSGGRTTEAGDQVPARSSVMLRVELVTMAKRWTIFGLWLAD
jgi:hypothetical protein